MATVEESRARRSERHEPRLDGMRKYLRTDRRYSTPHCTVRSTVWHVDEHARAVQVLQYALDTEDN